MWGQGRAEGLASRSQGFEQSNHSDRRGQRDGGHRQDSRGAGRMRPLPVGCFYVSVTWEARPPLRVGRGGALEVTGGEEEDG